LVIGYWLLVIGYWLLVIGDWLLGTKKKPLLQRGARASCPLCHASCGAPLPQGEWASRPLQLEKFTAKPPFLRKKTEDGKRRSRFFNLFIVAGTSCPSPSLEHPAPSYEQQRSSQTLLTFLLLDRSSKNNRPTYQNQNAAPSSAKAGEIAASSS
jgi:hypothetical protein